MRLCINLDRYAPQNSPSYGQLDTIALASTRGSNRCKPRSAAVRGGGEIIPSFIIQRENLRTFFGGGDANPTVRFLITPHHQLCRKLSIRWIKGSFAQKLRCTAFLQAFQSSCFFAAVVQMSQSIARPAFQGGLAWLFLLQAAQWLDRGCRPLKSNRSAVAYLVIHSH